MKSESGIVFAVVLALVLLAVGFAAFTGYVAYCGQHPFQLPDAFESPPREDAVRLGGVLEAGLTWALRVCGTVVVLLGAALAARRGRAGASLGSVVMVLAGGLLLTPSWPAVVAIAAVGAAAALGSGWAADHRDDKHL